MLFGPGQNHQPLQDRPQAHSVDGKLHLYPVKIATCLSLPSPLPANMYWERKTTSLTEDLFFSTLPYFHLTLSHLLCFKCWDHFDLVFVTAVRTAETEQTQKNWNQTHISVLIYLSVDLSHWLPTIRWTSYLTVFLGGHSWLNLPTCLVTESTFKGKPAHSAVCSCLFTKTFRTYLLSVNGRTQVWKQPSLPTSSPISDTVESLDVFSAEGIFPSFFIFKYWPNLKRHPQNWDNLSIKMNNWL